MTRTYRLYVTVTIEGDPDTVPTLGQVADAVDELLRNDGMEYRKVVQLEAEDRS